jgi:hypothetical protein
MRKAAWLSLIRKIDERSKLLGEGEEKYGEARIASNCVVEGPE